MECQSLKPKKRRTKQPKERPNFFIAIQVTNTTISESVQQVQDHIRTQLPELAPKDFIKLHKLHITAFVLCIKSADDLQRVVSVIEKSKDVALQFFPNGTLPALSLQGVRSFEGNRVVWIDLEHGNDKELLTNYVDTLHQFFKDNLPEVGFEKKKFIPHITLFKSRKRSKNNKVLPEHYDGFKDYLFGRQSIEHLKLVAMEEEEPVTRFYKCVCKYDFATASCVVINHPSSFYFHKPKELPSAPDASHLEEESNNNNNNGQESLTSNEADCK